MRRKLNADSHFHGLGSVSQSAALGIDRPTVQEGLEERCDSQHVGNGADAHQHDRAHPGPLERAVDQ